MESPVVVDKPPEYHGNDRGFPFEEEESTGAWSELAARHPDIAARLRQRPATWARKRRPSSHDATDDFGDGFGGFDRFPFDDIPPEFRDHFPSHWNRRFGSREEPQHTQQSQSPPQHQTTATQTEHGTEPTDQDQPTSLPQYGLRNTVDLGQKSPADPSLVDADERTQRSMSAPPDAPNQNKMSGQNHQEQAHSPPHAEQGSNVRHIPIFVEGRDQPLINKTVDHGTHFGETKPAYVPPPQQPHIDRDQYFTDDVPGAFYPPPNFSRAFNTPFNKNFRQGPQPFVQQKVYPQAAFARGASPQRSQSPKPQIYPEEHFIKVPVHHDQPAQKTEPPSRAQKVPQQHQQAPPQQHHAPPPQQHHAAPPQQHHAPPPQQHHAPPQQQQQQAPPQAPQREQTPPQTKPQAPSSNDPITLILSIQTDVLNLMTDVENFTGSKKDKKYLFLDEMLTRNLIKLDNIETDGKENIRQARKEAIKCIQKCIAVLEAKAESQNAAPAQAQEECEPQPEQQPQTQDVEMKENVENVSEPSATAEPVIENGEVEMKEATKEEKAPQAEAQAEKEKTPVPAAPAQEEKKEEPIQDKTEAPKPSDKEAAPAENKEESQPQAADTRPDENKSEEKTESKLDEQKPDEKDKKSPKKATKTGKKRDKSKDKTDSPKDSSKEENLDTDKKQEEQTGGKVEAMQVDDKGDKRDSQVMDVDGGASQ